MDHRIVIFGLFFLGIHKAVSLFQKSDFHFVLNDDGSKQFNVSELDKAVDALFDPRSHDSFVMAVNDPEVKIWQVDLKPQHFSCMLLENCDIMSMSAIKLALENSRPGSRLWVFADEAAGDLETNDNEIVELSQKMGSQIYVVETHPCRHFQMPSCLVYYALAEATNGQVFNLEKTEIKQLLKYIKDGPKNIITRQSFWEPETYNQLHDLHVYLDNQMGELTIAMTGHPNQQITVKDLSRFPVNPTDITRLNEILVVEFSLSPGRYTVELRSKGPADVVVSAPTLLTFQHGFSTDAPSDLNETTRIPVPGISQHLSVKLFHEEDLQLLTVRLLDMKEKHILAQGSFPLNDTSSKHFYTTEKITIPNQMFKIAVTLYDSRTGNLLTRHGLTPITPKNSNLDNLWVPGDEKQNEKLTADKCQQPQEVGLCFTADKSSKWHYDNTIKECVEFLYSGCLGNANRFDSKAGCRAECAAPAPPAPLSPVPDKCQQPMEAGPCRSEVLKWYYDNTLNECRTFMYGGCLGNENMFESEEACRGECGGAPSQNVIGTYKCLQPMEAGPCDGEFPKWYYDNNVNECRMFIYSGCLGNENMFESEEACRGECRLPIDEPTSSKPDQNGELAATEKTLNTQNNELCKHRDNELETFGQYVVSSLHKLNERAAINAQNEIQNVLSKYKLRNLKKTSS